MDAAALDDRVLEVAVVLAGGRRNVAFAAEAAADVGGELAGGDDPVAVIVGVAREARAQEVGKESAGLEAVGDQAGQILLRAEQAHHVGAVDQVAEAAEKQESIATAPCGCAPARTAAELGIGHRRVEQLDRLAAAVQLARRRGHVDLVAMAGEEEQEEVVRARRAAARVKAGDRLAGGLLVGQHGAGGVEQAGAAQAVVQLPRILVGIGQVVDAPAIVGDADQQRHDPLAAGHAGLARHARARRERQPIVAGFAGAIGGDDDHIFAVLGEHGVDPAVGRVSPLTLVSSLSSWVPSGRRSIR